MHRITRFVYRGAYKDFVRASVQHRGHSLGHTYSTGSLNEGFAQGIFWASIKNSYSSGRSFAFTLLAPQGLTENQNRLLYMVSLYTHKADNRGDRDHWLRKPALVVLLYEGIVANVLDFDYAPQSELIENRRIWMNVSQVRRLTVSGSVRDTTQLLLVSDKSLCLLIRTRYSAVSVRKCCVC